MSQMMASTVSFRNRLLQAAAKYWLMSICKTASLHLVQLSVSGCIQLLTHSLVMRLIVNCGLPISIVDDPHFSFTADLDPKFHVPCKQTVTHSILPALERHQQRKLQKLVDSCPHDGWPADILTDRRSYAFLGITVHTFTAGHAVSHLLTFRAFRGSHPVHRMSLQTIHHTTKKLMKHTVATH